jgi:hypothetical protein
MGHSPVAGTGDLHVMAPQPTRTLFGRLHQSLADPLAANAVIHHQRHETASPGGVLKQRKCVKRCHARDNAIRLGHQQRTLRISEPVLQPGSHVIRFRWIPQLIKQRSNQG